VDVSRKITARSLSGTPNRVESFASVLDASTSSEKKRAVDSSATVDTLNLTTVIPGRTCSTISPG
jgi:hypothetical protein